jgi:diguanylate cyclase (GGDEF)-like protein
MHPHDTIPDTFARIEAGLAAAMPLKAEIVTSLEQAGNPGADLHPPLKRWVGATMPVDQDLRRLQDMVSAHAGQIGETAVRWVDLGITLAFVALVICMLAGVAGTAFVVRYIALPLDWGARILRKLAAGRRDLIITVPDRQDEIGALFSAFADYQESLRQGEALAVEVGQQRARLDTALNNMAHGLAMFDASGCLILCNRRYVDLYALPPNLATPGTPLDAIVQYRAETGSGPRDLAGFQDQHVARALRHEPSNYRLDLADGRTIQISHQPMSEGGWVATHEDITDAIRAEAQISHMATHDALTNLPNRVLFRTRIETALQRVARGEQIAVLCLDLDRFKSVNDALGHPVGDGVLTTVAQRLQGCVRGTDTVARLGGDEFAIVQAGANLPAGAGALAERIIEALGRPYDVHGHQIVIGASVGIAIAPNDGTDPDVLLKQADMALYRAKSDGRGTFRYFEAEMDNRMQMRRRLELDLRRALTEAEFELHYQPQLNLASGRVTGFEALLRWRHADGRLIPPGDFIPLAEEIGLIVPIGEWVLRQACRDAVTWPDDVRVAVNLSPVQFKSRGLVTAVFSALAASHLAASRLELEITESVLLDDSETVLSMLHQIKALGVSISMDDFGTGYSSLSYLRSFPFDKIKIDRSFVRDLATSGDAAAIIRAVAGLGSSLGMSTTAEGVETQEQLDQLRAEGCTEVQGYLISRPRPAGELGDLLFRDGGERAA